MGLQWKIPLDQQPINDLQKRKIRAALLEFLHYLCNIRIGSRII